MFIVDNCPELNGPVLTLKRMQYTRGEADSNCVLKGYTQLSKLHQLNSVTP